MICTLFAIVAVVAALLTTSAPAQAVKDLNCDDFPNQAAAQANLNNNPSDPNNLDSEGDGKACESLPCPCAGQAPPTPNPVGNIPKPKPVAPKPIKVVKVVTGDLLKVRQGTEKPFRVRLLGAKIPQGDTCFSIGAKRDLKAWIRPGRVVTLEEDSKAPKRDKQGNLRADVITKKGNFTIAGSQIGDGWADVEKFRFSERERFLRFQRDAQDDLLGAYGECVEGAGSQTNPVAVGATFEYDDVRYTFGVTDVDALPEMLAEQAANRDAYYDFETPPEPGWVYARVPVTVTSLSGSGYVDSSYFQYARGDRIFTQYGDDFYGGNCGSGDVYGGGLPPVYLEGQYVTEGESITGYICATVPGPVVGTDTWVVTDDDFAPSRFVSVD